MFRFVKVGAVFFIALSCSHWMIDHIGGSHDRKEGQVMARFL